MRSEITPTDSVWSHDAGLPTYGPLTQDLRVRVAVVGAGIAGLSTAYQLAMRGIPVAVIDDGPIGGGDTGATTAQVTCIVDKGYAETAKLRGEDGARLTAESHMAAIDTIERIARDESIACDFARMDGYLFLAEGDTLSTLSDERAAAVRAGLVDVELLSAGVSLGDTRLAPALRFPRQAHFHPLKYLAGLCRAIERMGGKIYCGTHVTRVNADAQTHTQTPASSRVNVVAPVAIETADGPLVAPVPIEAVDGSALRADTLANVTLETSNGLMIRADSVVLATHSPINDALGYSTRVFPALTYVIGLQIPKGSLPNFLAFDTADPYHYVRIQAEGDHDILIVGGEDHKTGQADDMDLRYLRLEDWAREQFPMAGAVRYCWSGQVVNSFDGLAMAGPDLVSKNVYVITGQTGIGMTHSTIGASIVADQIAGIANPWADLYAPARAPAHSLGEVVSEGLNVLSQYTELLKGGDVSSEAEIPAGSGAIIGWGPSKVAAYRDDQGVLHRRTALCSHLGCVVAWNDSAKTWDCPCHGSRFDSYGKVMNGPAPTDLAPVDE